MFLDYFWPGAFDDFIGAVPVRLFPAKEWFLVRKDMTGQCFRGQYFFQRAAGNDTPACSGTPAHNAI
jgi:hypothetical protein